MPHLVSSKAAGGAAGLRLSSTKPQRCRPGALESNKRTNYVFVTNCY